MDFANDLKQFSKRVESLKGSLQTEEATKTSIIMPFFAMLGYDVFNPAEFTPEYIADVGIKKGEKVDYAILIDGKPVILIEAKSITEKLDKHDSQLFRYFGTSEAKFAILTNGQIYRFYTDLEQTNKMDEKPFLEIDILNIKEAQINELKKFQKANFDINAIFDVASELKYVNEFKQKFAAELAQPSEEFVRFFLDGVYSGQKNRAVIDRFTPVVRKSLNQYISDTMNEKIKTALGNDEHANEETGNEAAPESEHAKSKERNIITTPEELEAYFIVKNILKDVVPMTDIAYRDAESYFNVLYKDNRNKWICRAVLTDTQKYLLIPDEHKKPIRYDIDNIYDIPKYANELQEVLKRYI